VKLTEIIASGAIVTALQSRERDGVITELIEALAATSPTVAKHKSELIAKVLEREKRGSTGFGKGVAVPHVKHAAIESMTSAIGLSQQGVDFASLDKQPVYSVFLLVSPESKPEAHLQAMEVIFKNLSKDTFRRFLRQAGSPDEVVALLEEADAQHLAG